MKYLFPLIIIIFIYIFFLELFITPFQFKRFLTELVVGQFCYSLSFSI